MSQLHSFSTTEELFSSTVIEASYQQPVLVDFWASWCNPCKMLMPLLEQLSEQYQGRFLLAKVESDQHKNLLEQYNVRSIPTVLLFKEGEVVERFTGVIPESEIRDLLDNQLPCAADKLITQARELYQDKQPDAARQQLELIYSDTAIQPRLIAAASLLLMEFGDYPIAAKHLERLPIKIETHPQVAPLRARLSFVPLLSEKHTQQELEEQLVVTPSDLDLRLQLAARQILSDQLEEAMESLLEIIKQDATFREGIARKQMLKVFEILGSSGELVHIYRLQMAKHLL